MTTQTISIASLVKDYRSMKALQKETERILKDLEAEILAYMDEAGKVEETGPDYTIKLTDCTRESLDKQALEQVFGEGLKAYMKTTSYKRLTIK
jgi:hypothetical protein